ncbi:MAG: hypothetical protein KBT04_04985, partial [Bacteroidales bacterium]|nr:hypothetical protein [Candidatus Colimorpha onthohippi]
MKKVFFFLTALSMGVIASAQFTVGLTGGFSFPGMKIEEKGEDNTSYNDMQSSYNAMLKFGYVLNERMSAGIGLGYQSSKSSSLECNIQMPDYTKHPGETVSQYFENSKSSAFLITPYFRFNLASYGALNLFVEAQVPVSIGTTSMEEEFKDSKNSKLDEVVPFVKTSTMG